MTPKQDRQGVRKASDIEQKYNLNQDFSEIEKLANDAQRAAAQASNASQDAINAANETRGQLNTLSSSVSQNSKDIASHSQSIASLDSRVYILEHLDPSGGSAPIASGTYTGGGTFGSGNPNTLTFDFKPKLLIVTAYAEGVGDYPWVYGAPKGRAYSEVLASETEDYTTYSWGDVYVDLTWGSNSVSWYNAESAEKQLNANGYVYYYFAVGEA